MATKKPKTNRGEPDFDISQKDVSRQLKGQKLSSEERREIARRTRFENDYLFEDQMEENHRRSKQASRARQGRINVTKSKTTKAKTTPKTSLYNRLTGSSKGTVGAGSGLGDYTLR